MKCSNPRFRPIRVGRFERRLVLWTLIAAVAVRRVPTNTNTTTGTKDGRTNSVATPYNAPPLVSSAWCDAFSVPALLMMQRRRRQHHPQRIRRNLGHSPPPSPSHLFPRSKPIESSSIGQRSAAALNLYSDENEAIIAPPPPQPVVGVVIPVLTQVLFDTSGTAPIAVVAATVDTDATANANSTTSFYLATEARLVQAAHLRRDAERLDRELSQSKLIKLQTTLTKLEQQQQQAAADTSTADETRLKTRRASFDSETRTNMERMQAQIRVLQQKLGSPAAIDITPAGTRSLEAKNTETVSPSTESHSLVRQDSTASPTPSTQISTVAKNRFGDDDDTVAGFDKADLDLYLPVAVQLYEQMPNATADERLDAFRAAPELQDNFSAKLTKLLLEPMQDMQRLEELKEEYLACTSSKAKGQLKREIDSLAKSLDKDGPFSYSDSVNYGIPRLEDSVLEAQINVVKTLPEILQTLYKKRHDLDSDASLELAVLLEHYEAQLQLLEQVQLIEEFPLPSTVREEVVQGLESLPTLVRNHLAARLDLDPNDFTMDELVLALCSGDDGDEDGVSFPWNPLKQVAIAASATPMETADEYDDITFIDRSRYVEEFFPAVARMEGQHPTLETVETFTKWLARDKKTFMANSKPERVVGGYYIRGQNLADTDEAHSGARLLDRIQKRIQEEQREGKSNSIHDQLEFFYILDPSPQTDEEVELELRSDPILLVTGRNESLFYNYASPQTKLAVSLFGLLVMTGFSLGLCTLEPSMREQLGAAWTLLLAGESVDLDWLLWNVSQLVMSLLFIQTAHECGHRCIAWRDKFEIGLPTLLPSIQLGSLGAITRFSSPPSDLKSMFDFGVAGPLAGVVASLFLFVYGLSATASLDYSELALLPALPIDLLRSSALGGGLIELFLGKGTLNTNAAASNSVLALHPTAIAGFVGTLGNALALLPIGNTDGGRVSLAMFRRRGAYVVQVFTTALLCIAGLLGLDDMGVLLTYTLFSVIFQAELETPARNEVDEINFGRGAFGIAMAVVVSLTLLPM